MRMSHSVQVNLIHDTGQQESVLRSKRRRMPKWLFRWFFGEIADVLVLVPGKSVNSVVIRELRKECKSHEAV